LLEAMMVEILERKNLRFGARYFLLPGLLIIYKDNFQRHQTLFCLNV